MEKIGTQIQADLLHEGDSHIVVSAHGHISLPRGCTDVIVLSGEVEARDAEITARGASEIHARGESRVILFDWAQCDATDYTYVEAYEHSDVKLRDESSCRAHDNSRAHVYDSSSCEAFDMSFIVSSDEGHIIAHDHSQNLLYGNSHGNFYDRSSLVAFDSVRANIRDTVVADVFNAASVVATQSSIVRVGQSYDEDSQEIFASSHASVILCDNSTATVSGGHVVNIGNVEDWCDYNGLDATYGIVTLYPKCGEREMFTPFKDESIEATMIPVSSLEIVDFNTVKKL